MSLYLTLFRLSLQEAIQYRVESAIYFLYDVLPPIMMAFVWLTAYEGQESVAGFSLSQMLVYTVGVMILRAMLTAHVEWAIDHEVRQGILSTYLVKPINVWAQWFVSELAWKMVRGMLIAPVLLGCLIWLGGELALPPLDAGRIALLVVSLVLAYLVCFTLKLCLGMLTFWTTDINGIMTLYEVVVAVFGGVLVPLALLPAPLYAVALALPLRAIYDVPLTIVLGRLDGPALWWSLLSQVAWLVVLALLARYLWRHGLRRYEAVGG
ncbi:MAG: ABC-2 family transporter protein [Chloroflexota bacterium]|nr:ABC-2 family transporter protein [Chloroflexota bacterium]